MRHLSWDLPAQLDYPGVPPILVPRRLMDQPDDALKQNNHLLKINSRLEGFDPSYYYKQAYLTFRINLTKQENSCNLLLV